MVRASAFADDLVAYLRNAAQLPRFKHILRVYERGSGAKNSWGAKTQGLRIGASQDDLHDPLPPGWDPSLVSFDNAFVRTLGVFMGTPHAVATEWQKRTTQKVTDRFNLWRRTKMPNTLYGKSLIIKNSVLAACWYLISHQTPPDAQLDAFLSTWQKEAFAFLDQSLRAAATGARGTTIVSRSVLVQDHADHGARITDVECFARAHYARWARHLVTPPLATYKHFVHHYVDTHYGHLRQGARLFLSSCDFLQLDTTYPFWRNALIAAGMFHTIPNPNPHTDPGAPTAQPLTKAELSKATIPYSSSGHSGRRVLVRPSWTLLEVLMEPLFYNCNYNDNAGGRICDSRDDGKNWMYHTRAKTMTQCQLHRVSPARRMQADKYYAYTRAMAQAGLTHTMHLLTGFNPGETLRWLEHSDLVARCTSRQIPVPCTADHLTYLRSCMPTQWKSLLEAAIRAKQPHHDTAALLNTMTPPPDAWYRHRDLAGHPDAQSDPPRVLLTHHVSPTGVITSRRTGPSSVPLSSCSQIHAWLQRRPLTNQAAKNARDRALARGEPDPFPPTILTSGAVANPAILPISSPFPHGANPSHFSLTYPLTDRLRQPTPLHETNVNHLYFSQVALLFRPIRTLDPDHRPTTQTSTSYTHLLHHPTKSPDEVRQAIVNAPMDAKLPPRFRETQFHVQCDDHHIGDRCVKKGTRKGVCDLCLALLNRRTPETLQHILLECPFTQPVVTTVWRSIFLNPFAS